MLALCVFTVIFVGGGILYMIYSLIEAIVMTIGKISEGIHQKSWKSILLGIIWGLVGAGIIYIFVLMFNS